MKRIILICAPLMALGLFACNDSGTNASGSMTTVGSAPLSVDYTINIPIKQTSTYFVSASFDCQDSGVYVETWEDTLYYKAASGTLLYWNKRNCFAELGRGSGSKLNGAWTFSGEYGDAVNVDTTTCNPLDTVGDGPSKPMTLTFTNTTLSVYPSDEHMLRT